jgi:3-oxoacyl-(acyl-carrier-protein) synthase/SAM-dependent methyltransferase
VSASTPPAPGAAPGAPLSAMQQAIVDIRALRGRLEASEGRMKSPVAIVGMSCRFPGGADTLDRFWDLLDNGVDAIAELPTDRWDVAQYYDPDPDAPAKMSARFGGFLTDVDAFDAEFFGISDREAVSVDPQHRLLLEAGWSALEDAGFAAESIFGSNTGVFVGISSFDYASLRGQMGDPAQVDAYHATGVSHAAGGGRLSYYFGLQGPSVSLDTACSSSLVALHLACQSLRSGECNAALAGGINLILSPDAHVTLSKAKMLAPDGRCKAFDAAADGFVRSEGCGMLVLKRLDDALRDGDRIHAVIKGSACNQDGRSSGLSAPNGPSQTAVVKAAWAAAGVAPDDIDYIEAHGTGTALGDPIEAGALDAALKAAAPGHRVSIGSVKTNLGHMEAAAGVGGVIKTALAMQRERIPASLHFKQGSPNIDWASSKLDVVAETTTWPRANRPRRAGVSSFGFSGTNVHMVIEEAPLPPATGPVSSTRILAISAMQPNSLRAVAKQLAQSLRAIQHQPAAWASFTHSLNARRSHFPVRAAFVASSPEEAIAHLEAFGADAAPHNMLVGSADLMRPPALGMVFGDVPGPISDPRSDALYASSQVFRNAVDACPAIGAAGSAIERDGRSFAIQWGLAQTWQAWSTEPVSLRGDGVGAFVVACVAGMLNLGDALALVAARRAYLEADTASETAMLASYQSLLATLSFASPRLSGTSLNQDYWHKEIVAAKTGIALPLNLGRSEDVILLDLTPNAVPALDRLTCATGASLRTAMLEAVAALYIRGGQIAWRLVEEPAPGRALDLPGYPWDRRRYWFPKMRPNGREQGWPAIVSATSKQADQTPIDMHLHSYGDKYRALANLAAAYIIQTLGTLGALDQADATLSAERLVSDYGVLPLYRQLMSIWLNRLADAGTLLRQDDLFVTSGLLIPEPVEPYIEAAEPVFAEERIMLDYITGCGAVLTQVVRGEVNALETLFPKGSIELAERIYHQAALSRYFNAIAGAAAGAFAAEHHGPIRALEVGGGTGGVTGSILSALPAGRTRYTFSDVSAYFFEPAAKRFADFDFVDFAVLDLEQSPEAQGFRTGSYDLIVAANVLHATADLGETLDLVRSLLAPGGALLLYEVTHPPAYFDISIALIEGWQKSSDNIRTVGPLIDTDTWRALLTDHGFDLVEAWPRTTSPAELLGSHVFMARATGTAGVQPGDVVQGTAATFTLSTQATPDDPVLTELADAPDSEHRNILTEFVRRRVASVLKRPEGSDVPADRRLMDLGLDSLMALELRTALATSLGFDSLPSTLMFDYPSITEIAGFLLTRIHGDGDADASIAAPNRVPVFADTGPQLTQDDVDELSDAQVEALLAERLGSPAGDGL